MSVLNYEELTMDSEMFQTVRENFDLLFQKLLKKMLDNDSGEGSITLKVDVELEQEWIPVSGEHSCDERMVQKPTIKHKITTAVPVKDSMDGKKIPNMELVFDPQLKRYVLKYMTGMPQMSIFDEEIQNGVNGTGNDLQEPPALTGPVANENALPGEVVEGEFTEVEESEETPDDSEETDNFDELVNPEEEDYEYEPPEEGYEYDEE